MYSPPLPLFIISSNNPIVNPTEEYLAPKLWPDSFERVVSIIILSLLYV
jgi:hypothetical protein